MVRFHSINKNVCVCNLFNIFTFIIASPYPSNDMKIFIQDTTPSDKYDRNMDYNVYDTSYNLK